MISELFLNDKIIIINFFNISENLQKLSKSFPEAFPDLIILVKSSRVDITH